MRFAVDFDAFAPPPTEAALSPALVAPGLAAFSFPDEAQGWLLTASVEGCASEPLRRSRVLVDACLGLVLEHPRFDAGASFGLVPMGELAAEWWPLHALAVRASTRWLLEVPRSVQTTAFVAFEPSLGVAVHLGK